MCLVFMCVCVCVYSCLEVRGTTLHRCSRIPPINPTLLTQRPLQQEPLPGRAGQRSEPGDDVTGHPEHAFTHYLHLTLDECVCSVSVLGELGGGDGGGEREKKGKRWKRGEGEINECSVFL